MLVINVVTLVSSDQQKIRLFAWGCRDSTMLSCMQIYEVFIENERELQPSSLAVGALLLGHGCRRSKITSNLNPQNFHHLNTIAKSDRN